jgi:hypothetical protein
VARSVHSTSRRGSGRRAVTRTRGPPPPRPGRPAGPCAR